MTAGGFPRGTGKFLCVNVPLTEYGAKVPAFAISAEVNGPCSRATLVTGEVSDFGAVRFNCPTAITFHAPCRLSRLCMNLV